MRGKNPSMDLNDALRSYDLNLDLIPASHELRGVS
jgi:hypothetical protein